VKSQLQGKQQKKRSKKVKYGWYLKDSVTGSRLVSMLVFDSAEDAMRGARRACRVTVRKHPQIMGTYKSKRNDK
jgi:hypothetical protein